MGVFNIRQEKKLWNISNKSLVAIKASLVITVLIGLVVFIASVLPAFADLGGASVWTTDSLGNVKNDFEPGEIVYIRGTGFNPNSQINIILTRPDQATETCDATSCNSRFLNGLQSSDAEGYFVYVYDLDGIVGEYKVSVSDGINSVNDFIFTDARNINWVKLNGSTSITVQPSSPINVTVNVTTTGSGQDNDWESTRYAIEGGGWQCNDTPDHTSSGINVEWFIINAPITPGVYDITFRAYGDDSCSETSNGGPSNNFTLINGITVTSPVCGNGAKESGEACDDGNTANCDGCKGDCSRLDNVCGDSIIECGEGCDDSNTNNLDGCSNACVIENGWSCTGTPSVCKTINQNLTSSCGIDMMLIIDSSGSIDSSHLTTMKNAFKNFTDTFLPNTPTQIAVVDFDTVARLALDYSSNINDIKNAIDSATIGGNTNWEDALIKAHNEYDNRADKPDLYVFASDGNPNTIGSGQSVSEPVALAAAVTQANHIKLSGIRIITLGIGSSVNSANLIAISGSDAYYSTGFDTLAQTLADLADDLCGGTISVKKLVDGQPASGWQFSTSVTGGTSNPTSSTTGADGFINPIFDINISDTTATVDVTETSQGGYGFVSAHCYKNQQEVGTPGQGTVTGIIIGKNDAIYCEFNNTARGCNNDNDCTPDYYTCDGNNVTKHDFYCDQNDYTCKETTSLEQNCDNNDDTYCSGTERWIDDYYCYSGACNHNSQKLEDCNNGLWCDGRETCDDSNEPAICVSETPVNCDDSVSCTVDSCNESTDSCDHIPTNSLCDNGLWCDGLETCDATLGCQVVTPVNCSNLNGQCQAGVCNETSDKCEADYSNYPLSTSCESDGNLCTIDHCDGSGSCLTYDNVPVPPAEQCKSFYCDPMDGQIKEDYSNYPLSTPCESDGNLCTIDHCDGSGSCIKDYDVDCSGLNNQCQVGVCNPSDGQCYPDYSNYPLSTPCDNDLWCDGPDHCNGAGNCINLGPVVDCDDKDICTIDTCDEDYDRCVNTFSDIEGPRTYNVITTPPFNNGIFNLTGTAQDKCSNILTSKYYIGTGLGSCDDNNPFLITGTMDPADGNYDQLIEDLKKFNVQYMHDGQNFACIKSWDVLNNVGNCNCTYFDTDILPPDCPYDIYLDDVVYPNEYLICGNNTWLNTSVCDSQSSIQGGEYFIDPTPGVVPEPWSGYWMNVLEEFIGEHGYHCAIIGAQVDTSQLSDGTHYIKLRGKDTVENWGKFLQCKNISFIRDTKPPITTKTLISADGKQHACESGEEDGLPVGVSLTDGCNYVKGGTQVVLHARDQDTPDHEFADKVKIHWIVWYKINPGDQWVIDQQGVGNEEQNVTITLTNDSYHLIEYWAVDSCGWEETHHFELDIVDNKAPVTTKTVGDPKLAGNGFDWWITNHTLITLNCTDQTPHPVNHVTLYAKYKVDDRSWVNLTTNNGYVQFTFPEDSIHTLEYYCVDELGNTEGTNIEVDRVDTTQPMTTKTYGTPYYTDGLSEWINSSTPITLTAVDGGAVCAVGNVTTYWMNTIVDNPACAEPGVYCYPIHNYESSGWNTYVSPFTKPGESCHLIEYYSIDALGNKEPIKTQCVYVENTPPVIDKTIDSPKHNCTQSEWEQYGSPDYGCWYITNHTKITLNCYDVQPHPVDNVTLYWRDYLLGQTAPAFTPVQGGYTEITKEDSEHVLEFYCEDALGNSNGLHKEIDIVDTKPPVINKTLGDPNHTCEGGEGCDYYITKQTPITLTCTDQDPHPVDHEVIYWRYQLNNNGTWFDFSHQGTQFTFTFPEDSNHTLEYWCEDALHNTAQKQTEIDIVDTIPPQTTKNIIGPQFYNATENKTYIDGVTEIELTCVDQSPHPVDHTDIYYRYRVDDGDWNSWTKYTGKFKFPEESKHELEYFCNDTLGNEEIHNFEIDYVDHTPPVTTKNYGTPYVAYDSKEWINSSTPIILIATDGNSIHASGVKEIKYRVTTVNDNDCISQTACNATVGSGNFNTYSAPFTIGQESCHLIEYYSVDNVDKTETTKRQCVYVENTPPEVSKDVGTPKVESTQMTEYLVPETYDIKDRALFVNQSTPITLTCTDPAPHPVDQVQIYYKYYNDGQLIQNWTLYTVPFTYGEDTYHELYYYCVDALGNRGPTHYELDIVDTQPPVSQKTFDGINITCSQLNCANSKDCDYYITQNTKINLTCSDLGSHPVDDVKIYYRYFVDDQPHQDWTLYTGPIQYNEDSKHYLEWYCIDALSNKEETHNQTERVDTLAPNTTKTVGDPKWGENDYWVTSNTPITLTTTDKESPCASGPSTLYYEVWWDSDCNGTIDTKVQSDSVTTDADCKLNKTIYLNEECLHEIRWHAVDALGNVETEHTQLHKVDDTPPHVLILKPVDGWYSDGEDIPIVAIAEDLTNPHGPCEDPLSGMCAVGIENGRQCYAYLIDVLPHFQSLELQTKGTLLYNNVSHECQGYATIPSPSGLPDGIAFLAVSADDNLGNMGNSLMEIFHTIAMECGCEEDNIYYCPQSCIVDVLQDIVTIWNLPKIGIDNNPIDVTITEPLDLTVLKGTPFNVSANISDSVDGEITSAITTGTPCYITLGGVSLGTVPYINEEIKCSGTMVIPNSLPQGLLELKVEIADNAGNIGFGVINVIHDTIPPTDVNIWKDDEKKDLYYDQDGDYTLHWEANDVNLDYYELFENDTNIYNTTGNNTLFVDKVDGTYEYYVIAHDMGGWTTKSNEIKVIVDSQNPDIEITGTVPGIGFFIATYTVSDPAPSSGIDRIEVTDTNGYALCSGTSPNGFCTVFLGSELELTVYDKTGNSDTDSTSGTEKDITPPTIIYSSPSGVIAYKNPILEVRTNESSTCYYGINDNITEMTQMTADGGKTTHTVNLETLTDGLKVYHVICKDLAENYMDSSKTIVFYIDTTGNYQLVIPDYGHYWSVGWNTFFLPQIMLDDICGVENGGPYNVTDVLSSLDGENKSFDMIWYFNGEEWLWYDPTFSEYQLLTEFNDEQSLPYYIRMIREDRLEITQDICQLV